MSICIVDPFKEVQLLKVLFPSAEVLDWNSNEFYSYDTLFIVLPFRSCIDSPDMVGKLRAFIIRNRFQKVVLFDTHEDDYDPSTIAQTIRIDFFFKRHYTKEKHYTTNVHAFPFMMCDEKHLYSGKDCGIPAITKSEVPNQKTFIDLSSGVLLLQRTTIHWPFYESDSFSEETLFLSEKEYQMKVQSLQNDITLHTKCLENQKRLYKTYFTKEWLSLYIKKKLGIHEKVTLFLTSCGRPDLLRKTLESFVKYNTYPIEKGIIMEDSGKLGINDFAHELVPFPLQIIYNSCRLRQMKSIENGLQYLTTPYVFHCEEDWEFFNYGFIEKSMEILNSENGSHIISVWLREWKELENMYKFRIVPIENESYCMIGPTAENGVFSWNPGLKRIEIAKKFSPYTQEFLPTICEGGLDKAFRNLGMRSAITDKQEGYVKHIGWNDHVE